jgi:hypothetical protein
LVSVIGGTPLAAAGAGDRPLSSVDDLPASAAGTRQSGGTLDRLRRTLSVVLGASNRGVAERIQLTRVRSSNALEIRWAINTPPDGILSLGAAAAEARDILQSVNENPLGYRRVTLKGTLSLPGPGGPAELAVVRAVYLRSTVEAIEFERFDPEDGQTILDLADELRLGVVLGGYGIPSEPPTERRRRGAL